jgi:homoserine kinase
MTTHDSPAAVNLEIHPGVEPTIIVPTVRLSTHRARGVLPIAVPHANASFNAGRAALLVHALANDPDLLFDATEDKLHQEYRAPVMKQTWALVSGLRERGIAATVSGAGPTVLVLDRADNAPIVEQEIARVLDASEVARTLVDEETGTVTRVDWRVIRPGFDHLGAQYEQL